MKDRFGTRVRDIEERSAKRIYFTIEPKDIRELTVFLFEECGCRFNIASAVDNLDCFEILYHFSKDEIGTIFSARVFLKDKKNAKIDSITPLLKGANWIEREIHELFGIDFPGHPKLERLLLPDDWPDGVYPLRKDFVPPQRDDRQEVD